MQQLERRDGDQENSVGATDYDVNDDDDEALPVEEYANSDTGGPTRSSGSDVIDEDDVNDDYEHDDEEERCTRPSWTSKWRKKKHGGPEVGSTLLRRMAASRPRSLLCQSRSMTSSIERRPRRAVGDSQTSLLAAIGDDCCPTISGSVSLASSSSACRVVDAGSDVSLRRTRDEQLCYYFDSSDDDRLADATMTSSTAAGNGRNRKQRKRDPSSTAVLSSSNGVRYSYRRLDDGDGSDDDYHVTGNDVERSPV